uniref:SemiSWEET transporter n=1 Tax=Polynucleobacter sp. TaxID=2029855 RepID=UPI004048BF83
MVISATLAELIGYIAACLTTLAFLPQTLHSLKTKDLSGISLGMYSLFSVGVGLWLIYGVLIHSWPVILANFFTLCLALSILFLKLKYKIKHDAR